MLNSEIVISERYRPLLQSLGLDSAAAVFSDARLRVWRDLEDRDNSTLDATRPDGSPVRLHLKRDKFRRHEPMSLEAEGITLLNQSGIASAPLVAYGYLGDRTFVITKNLDGYLSADRLMETNVPRASVLVAMADLAAKLHNAGLHHRDLYANHFYMRSSDADAYDVRLIDTARVRKLPIFFRERWIVKDVAQLFFSVIDYADADASDAMWAAYLAKTNRRAGGRFVARVKMKTAWIERHDRALRERKPKRNLRLADGN